MAGCHLPASARSSQAQAEREGFPQKGLPSPWGEHTNPAVPHVLALPHESPPSQFLTTFILSAPEQSWRVARRPFVRNENEDSQGRYFSRERHMGVYSPDT